MATVFVDTHSTYYRISKRASESSPAAICIHGSGADSIVWSFTVSRLSRQFRILAPDLPGHGKSAGAPLDSAGAYARWLDRFALSVRLNKFFLIGHSFGGAIVQEYARMHPDKLTGLILVATGPAFSFSRKYRELVGGGTESEKLDLALAPEPIRQGYELLKNVSGPQLHADLMAAGSFDSSPWISSVAVPSLVLWGSSDFITERKLSESLARLIPNATFQVIEGAGHTIMIEAAKAFNAAAAEFMQLHAAD